MYTCENRNRGCSRVFERKYGLNIHLRSCIHKKSLKNPSPINFTTLSNTKGDITTPQFPKQRCDLPLPASGTAYTLDDNTSGEEDLVPLHEIRKFLGEDLSIEASHNSVIEEVMLSLAHPIRLSARDTITHLIKLLNHSDFNDDFFKRSARLQKTAYSLKIMQ